MILPLLLSALLQPATQPTTQSAFPQRAMQPDAAELAVVRGGPAEGVREGGLEPLVLIDGPMPTTFDVADDGTLFVAFPRWLDPVNFTVAKVDPDSAELTPFPDAETNAYHPDDPERNPAAEHFVCVQAVRFDPRGRLWVLDTGAVNMGTVTPGGAKLWGYDTNTGERLKAITFEVGPDKPVREKSYLNDVRFTDTHAFITDSGVGGIIVVELETGEAWRKLDGNDAVKPDESITLMAEGHPLKIRTPDGQEKPVLIASDGIALSSEFDGAILFTPLTGRKMFSASVPDLIDRDGESVGTRKVADMPSANDGIALDGDAWVYTTDFEDNAIRRISPAGEVELVVQDERLIWPDCVIVKNGRGYVSGNQLSRQPQFHRGEDLREGPYAIYTFPIPE